MNCFLPLSFALASCCLEATAASRRPLSSSKSVSRAEIKASRSSCTSKQHITTYYIILYYIII